MTRPRPRSRARSTPRANALALFGLARGKMESRRDREAMALILRHSGDERMQAIARDALDPLWSAKSLAAIIEMRGASWPDVSREYNNVKRSIGLMRAADHLPDLIEQVAIDAASRDESCPKCDGTGTVTKQIDKKVTTVRCARCRGRGTVHILGDTDRLRMMFDTFGLTGKGSGPVVNLDLRTVNPREDLTALSASIAPILDGEGRNIP